MDDVLTVDKLPARSAPASRCPPCSSSSTATVISDPAELGRYQVTAEIVGDTAGPKINMIHYKNKTGYRRRLGHRQRYTQVRITGIGGHQAEGQGEGHSEGHGEGGGGLRWHTRRARRPAATAATPRPSGSASSGSAARWSTRARSSSASAAPTSTPATASAAAAMTRCSRWSAGVKFGSVRGRRAVSVVPAPAARK